MSKKIIILLALLAIAIGVAQLAESQELGCWKETGSQECSNKGIRCLLHPDEVKYNSYYFGTTVGGLCGIIALYAAAYESQIEAREEVEKQLNDKRRDFRRLARRCKIIREER